METGQARTVTVPAPFGGLNAVDPLPAMPITDAVELLNLLPEQGRVRLRPGTLKWNTEHASPALIFPWITASGDTRMFSMSPAGALSEISFRSTRGLTGVEGTAMGLDVSYVNFKGRVILCGGVSNGDSAVGRQVPKLIQASTTTALAEISDLAITGINDPSSLAHVEVYKNRLYFCEHDSASIWYTGVNSFQGDVTEFPVDGVLKKGGRVLWCGSWTRDTGSSSEDLFVIVSSVGEIVLYQGTSPLDWTLQGRLYTGRPLSRRSFARAGSDLILATVDGVFPLSSLLNVSAVQPSLTDKIKRLYHEYVKQFGDSFGWELHSFPAYRLLLIQIPETYPTKARQLVYNFDSGGWAEWDQLNASTWADINGEIFFGKHNGVHRMSDSYFADDDDPIGFRLKTAFSYGPPQERNMNKRMCTVFPLVKSTDAVTLSVACDVNMQSENEDLTTTTSMVTGVSDWGDEAIPLGDPQWDEASWGTDGVFAEEMKGLQGVGRSFSVVVEGSVQDVDVEFYEFLVTYETGGIL